MINGKFASIYAYKMSVNCIERDNWYRKIMKKIITTNNQDR